MTSDERVSPLSQSSDSYGRTDGLTEIGTEGRDQSSTSVPRASQNDGAAVDEGVRSAPPTADSTHEVRCRRTVTGYHDDGTERDERCPWRGSLAEFDEHTEETGHEACTVCSWPLADDEDGACGRCLDRIRDDLTDIEDGYATLPTIVERSGYRMGRFPGGNALVMLADGSMASPQTPNAYTEPRDVAPTVHVEHPAITGENLTHPAYVEERVPSDGREHVRDHWKNDPVSVLAALEALERDWRHELGHGPADDIATVSGSVGYLGRWLATAARKHEAFSESVAEIRQLRTRILHAAGLADDPDPAPAECFECGGRLYRPYRPLQRTLGERLRHAAEASSDDDGRIRKHITAELQKHPDRPVDRKRLRVPSRVTRVRHAVAGDDREGRSDTLICSRCRCTYDEAQYALALKTRANSIQGWISVRVAAETLRRPEQTVWRWVRELVVRSACTVDPRRIVVEWEEVKQRSDEVGWRDHKKARKAS